MVTSHQCLRKAIDYLQQKTESGEYPPQNIWWSYAQLCRARNQEKEAQQALLNAYKLVKAKANLILDPDLQRSFLENVHVNAAVLAEVGTIQAAKLRV